MALATVRAPFALRSNSPEAAARILALVMISDGHVCRSELAALQSLGLPAQLGLYPRPYVGNVHTRGPSHL